MDDIAVAAKTEPCMICGMDPTEDGTMWECGTEHAGLQTLACDRMQQMETELTEAAVIITLLTTQQVGDYNEQTDIRADQWLLRQEEMFPASD